MKKLILSVLFTFELLCCDCNSQSLNISPIERGNKGKLFIFWGWNGADYVHSDIHFKGNNFDFTLKDVVAHDRQTPFGLDPYFKLDAITIPQTNFRIGYFINNHYNISLGADHMKYIVDQNQTVKISGNINAGSKYDGTYNNSDIALADDFLQLEHHNGLNYVNIEIERVDKITDLHRIGLKNIEIQMTEGIGFGGLYPRTGSTFLNRERTDDWKWSGYGAAIKYGFNIQFYKYFFIRTEIKGGFINLPYIKIDHFYPTDIADQKIWFLQENLVLGAIFRITK